jgi:hypothetical protein
MKSPLLLPLAFFLRQTAAVAFMAADGGLGLQCFSCQYILVNRFRRFCLG